MKSFSSAAVIIVASIGLAVIDARPRMCATRIFFLDGQSLKIAFGNFLPSFRYNFIKNKKTKVGLNEPIVS